jgi:hypothetical protein
MSTYVIFDGDTDGWAYQYIRGWAANRKLGFDFENSHEMDNMTSRAQSEDYVKRNLRQRMNGSTQVLVLLGEKTKNLYRYVRWEIELAIELGLPIIVVNLNKDRGIDDVRLPALLKGVCSLHIAYRFRAIKSALTTWRTSFLNMDSKTRAEGGRIYSAATYKALGLD